MLIHAVSRHASTFVHGLAADECRQIVSRICRRRALELLQVPRELDFGLGVLVAVENIERWAFVRGVWHGSSVVVGVVVALAWVIVRHVSERSLPRQHQRRLGAGLASVACGSISIYNNGAKGRLGYIYLRITR